MGAGTSVVVGPGSGVGETCVGGRIQVRLVWAIGPGTGVGDTCGDFGASRLL